MKLLDIASESFALGKKITVEKLVRKVLRSLPKKFDMKVTTIEESQDISSMKIDDLWGSLFTFEMFLNDKFEKKNKRNALQSSIKDHLFEHVEDYDDIFVVGAFLYLTASRTGIAFVVGVYARCQGCPKNIHFQSAKQIIHKGYQ